MLRLYWSDVLSPRKTCAVAKYLGAPVDYVYLDLAKGAHRTPEMLKLNPSGKVPILVDGDRVVCEADAIICHLARRQGSGLWPADSDAQIDLIAWFSWAAHHFGRACGALYFENIIKARFNIGPADAAVVAESLADFRRYAAVLDAHLASRTWLLGDMLSVADFSVAVPLPYADRAQMPLREFPNVRRWHDRLNEFPAWRDPFPSH